ncbi:hypothetical protein SLA2020_305880 [Shorea laevis]
MLSVSMEIIPKEGDEIRCSGRRRNLAGESTGNRLSNLTVLPLLQNGSPLKPKNFSPFIFGVSASLLLYFTDSSPFFCRPSPLLGRILSTIYTRTQKNPRRHSTQSSQPFGLHLSILTLQPPGQN